jgi:hypothetical protein
MMRRRRVLVVVAGAAAVWGAGPVGVPGAAGAWAAPAASSWGRAIEVPGLGALNKGGHAEVFQVSCGSAGNCAAGGFYHDRHGHGQGFVVSERNGRWGKAIKVPGLGALRKGTKARVLSVSCGSAGNCAAGGFYGDGDGHQQGFVVSEENGVWGRAVEVPGLGALNKFFAEVVSVSCGSAGDCAAGGFYAGSHGSHGFLVSEENGVWGQAIEVPGLAALAGPHDAEVDSVSCASAGNCAAGGGYQAGHAGDRGFVVSEQNGVWGQAITVPGLANLGRFAGVGSVSCGSPGNCAAGGDYRDRLHHRQGFVVRENNGVWGRAIKVPGLGALNKGGNASVNSVSCASPGNCAAAGSYTDRSRFRRFQGFVTLDGTRIRAAFACRSLARQRLAPSD